MQVHALATGRCAGCEATYRELDCSCGVAVPDDVADLVVSLFLMMLLIQDEEDWQLCC